MSLRDLIEMSIPTDTAKKPPAVPVRGKYDPTEEDVIATVGDQRLIGAYQRKPKEKLVRVKPEDIEFVYRVLKNHGRYATMGEIRAMVGTKVSYGIVRVCVDRLAKSGRVNAKWARAQGLRAANPPLAYKAM